MDADAVSRHQQLLESLLADLRDGQRATRIGRDVDRDRALSLLAPIADTDATVEWIAVNGSRIDAVLTAGDMQWRVVFGSPDGKTIEWIDVHPRPPRFAGVPSGRVVVVNGPSGAGKSTLMRAIQDVASFPVVVFDEPELIGTVQPGYLIWRDRAPTLHRGYFAAIAALARCGNYVAVSAAGHSLRHVIDGVGDIPTLTVGITCDPDVLNTREQRTGRWGGIAAQSLGVHDGWTYDIEFDTTNAPDAIIMARNVLARLTNDATPDAPDR